MKIKAIVSISICFATLLSASRSFSQDNGTVVAKNFISHQAKTLHGEEYEEARKIVRGDLNGDGKEDLVVLYTLEGFAGGNDYHQYLAVFVASGKTFQHAADTVVGGKNFRDVDLVSVTGPTINLDTKSYAKADPACCPSKVGKTKYHFAGNKLTETK